MKNSFDATGGADSVGRGAFVATDGAELAPGGGVDCTGDGS